MFATIPIGPVFFKDLRPRDEKILGGPRIVTHQFLLDKQRSIFVTEKVRSEGFEGAPKKDLQSFGA